MKNDKFGITTADGLVHSSAQDYSLIGLTVIYGINRLTGLEIS